MQRIVPQPSSPKLLKSMSDMEVNSITDDIINDIMNSVIKTSIKPLPKIKNLRYVSRLQTEKMRTIIENVIFYLMITLGIYKYNKEFAVEMIKFKEDNTYETKVSLLRCTDEYFEINDTKINYEYILNIDRNARCVFVKLVNTKSYILKSVEAKTIFDTLSKNMNYHMRYHKIDINISKYIPIRDSILIH